MQIQNNYRPSFQAKLILRNDFISNPKWERIAKKFQAQTATLSNDTMTIRKSSYPDCVQLLIYNTKTHSLKEHILSEEGSEMFLKLSEKNIVEKLKKLFVIALNTEQLPRVCKLLDDVKLLQSKYNIIVPEKMWKEWMQDVTKDEHIMNYILKRRS